MLVAYSGSSIGAIIHPIMLNKLFNTPGIAFSVVTQANAALVSFTLLVACILLREGGKYSDEFALQRARNQDFSILTVFVQSLKDLPFICFSVSCVILKELCAVL